MGWIAAVGVFLITLIFLARSPLLSSSMFRFNLFSRLTTQTATPQDALEPENSQDKISKETAEIKPEEDENQGSPQTTPKASAATPALQVPELNLEAEQTVSTASSETSDTNGQLPPSPSLQTTSSQMNMRPPPPRLSAQRKPPQPSGGNLLAPPKLKSPTPLRPPPSAAATLRGPAPRGNAATPAGSLTTSTLAPTQRSSRKVILEPGHSPLDWAALVSNPKNNLRGAGLPPNLIRVTPSLLKSHHGRKGVDAWTSYNGKVYNITAYLPFHPGGKGELMRGAGKESDKLFLEIHPWVNWEGILGECLVGIMVSEHEAVGANELDAMD